MQTSTEGKRLARFFRSLRLCGSVLALTGLPFAAHAAAAMEVDLKLVLANDVSGSINNEEFRLQRQGTAQAFLDPDVIQSIKMGALGRIAVSMVDFSSPGLGRVVIDWRIIDDETSAAAFAQLIQDAPRTPGRRTSVSNALEMGALLITASEADIVATRKVIDVAGDGPNNDGRFMKETHDKVVDQGITVNGLPIMDDNANGYYPYLDKYYTACVIGGRAAFAIVVRSFRDFGTAMRHKLILEISQTEPPVKRAGAEPVKPQLLHRIADEVRNPLSAPQVLRPGKNEFTDNCDIQGGFGGFNRF